MEFHPKHTHPNMFLIFLCLGLCASALMFWTMAYGPGISPDSTTYFMVARNLLTGKGFYGGDFSVAHYPPAYPLLLAVVSIFKTSYSLQAPRLLQAIFFGANIFLVVYVVQKFTDGSLWASVFALLLFISSAPLILIHSMAWSESPFIMFFVDYPDTFFLL